MEFLEIALHRKVQTYLEQLTEEFDLIPEPRKKKLLALSQYISDKLAINQVPKLNVICTHNSRRSHMGQLMLAAAADFYFLPQIKTYSAGTEATAFNIRAVETFRRIGFDIIAGKEVSNNPKYRVSWMNGVKPYYAFSKKINAAPNPQNDFAAIMVCTDADEKCPIVTGCDFRLALPFEDPKISDDTDQEISTYDERLREIGRAFLFVMSQVK